MDMSVEQARRALSVHTNISMERLVLYMNGRKMTNGAMIDKLYNHLACIESLGDQALKV
jgi:hypothetical protein